MSDLQLLKAREVAKMLSITPRTIRNRLASGSFPKPIDISDPASKLRAPRWPQSVIEKWLSELAEKQGAPSLGDHTA